MENNMPIMPNKENTSDVSANMSSSLSEGAVLNGAAPDDSGLDTPTHDEKPIIENHQEKLYNDIETPLIPKEGIRVVATEKGFYNQHRKSVGDEFVIPKIEMLGEWTKCLDPSLERQRIKFFKNKKAKK